jgi:DNA-directed RNA polymerase subunit RPC12/RpoP
MALIKCHECGSDVSSDAAACPKCGVKPKKPVKPMRSLGKWEVLGGLGIGILAIAYMANQQDAPAASAPSQADCSIDLACMLNKGTVAAGIRCPAEVEKLAKHLVRWTDGTLEPKFSRGRWLDPNAGSITMIGDKAEFQNGFGAWTPVVYECDLDKEMRNVLAVRVREGRLQ